MEVTPHSLGVIDLSQIFGGLVDRITGFSLEKNKITSVAIKTFRNGTRID